jgi:hypothetical protein
MALTASRQDLQYLDSGDLYDAFQFGTLGDTSWDFNNKTFHMDVKGSTDDASPLLSLTTTNNRIVVVDASQRVLLLDMSLAAIPSLGPPGPPVGELVAVIVPGCYVYDLIMIDGITTVRTPLMYGKLEIKHGATQE